MVKVFIYKHFILSDKAAEWLQTQLKLELELSSFPIILFCPNSILPSPPWWKGRALTLDQKPSIWLNLIKVVLFSSKPSAFLAKTFPRDRKLLIACFDFLASAFPSGTWLYIIYRRVWTGDGDNVNKN